MQNFGKQVVEKTKDMAETVKLNAQLELKISKLNTYYTQLGKEYYPCYKKGEPLETPLYDDIAKLLLEIEEIDNALLSLKDQRICESCGHISKETDHFCTNCGHRFEQNDSAQTATTPQYCHHCGGSLEKGQRFCTNCGKEVVAEEKDTETTTTAQEDTTQSAQEQATPQAPTSESVQEPAAEEEKYTDTEPRTP